MLGQADDWDDSLLMEIYYDSLKTHQTKKEKKNKKNNKKHGASNDVDSNPNKRVKFSTDTTTEESASTPSVNKETNNSRTDVKTLIANYMATKAKLTVPSTTPQDDSLAIGTREELTNSIDYNGTYTEPQDNSNNNQNVHEVAAGGAGADETNNTTTSANDWNNYYNYYSQYPSDPATTILQQPNLTTVSTTTTANSSDSSGVNMSVSISKEMVDEALQAMLQAVYQSGYTTGRYHLLRELSTTVVTTTTLPTSSSTE